MAGITEDVIRTAATWLSTNGHSLDAIAHPDDDTGRTLAALALHLNVFTASDYNTCELIADSVAYIQSGGTVCTHIGAMVR